MYLYTENLGIPLFPIGVLIFIVILIILWKNKRSLMYMFFFSLFWVYLMFGIDKVFFPLEISGTYVDEMRQISIISFINFTPFFLDKFGVTENEVTLIFYNILLTIPFGFGLNFLIRVRTKKIFIISFILGVGLEVVQLLISWILGYPYRVIDINDAFFNAIGVLLGYGLFKLFALLYLVTIGKSIDTKDGLLLFLDNVVRQKDKKF